VRLLVIEDDPRLRTALSRSLEAAGYAVGNVGDGQTGQEYAESLEYDLIVLDVMLPSKDGLAMCQALREARVTTARDAIEDRVRGLDSGADDYLVKPFATAELLARLRALLRREGPHKGNQLTLHDLSLDPATREVTRAGRHIDLTSREFALLELFLRRPNQVISRRSLETHVWSYDFNGVSNVVDVYIRRVRRKIDDPFDVKLLHTVRGAGYRLSLLG
jgi:DNA-binding response OmpR family regulator